MRFFRKNKAAAGENEPFVALMRVAQEDPEIQSQLIFILSQNRFNRVSILNSYIENLRLRQAPRDFISALACLLDDDIAQKALKILKTSYDAKS